ALPQSRPPRGREKEKQPCQVVSRSRRRSPSSRSSPRPPRSARRPPPPRPPPPPAPAPAVAPPSPVTVTADNGKVTIRKRPSRIVSLSPTATETLFAIGAGGQVVAVDDQSDYPRQAPHTSLSGYTPNVEAIASYRPDLVVAASDPKDLVS